jgi:hypothetical protein
MAEKSSAARGRVIFLPDFEPILVGGRDYSVRRERMKHRF